MESGASVTGNCSQKYVNSECFASLFAIRNCPIFIPDHALPGTAMVVLVLRKSEGCLGYIL